MLIGTLITWIGVSSVFDVDERFAICLWLVSVTVALSWQWRRKLAIWRTIVAGTVSPLAGYFLYWVWLRVELVKEHWTDEDLLVNAAAASLAGGLVSTVLGSAVFLIQRHAGERNAFMVSRAVSIGLLVLVVAAFVIVQISTSIHGQSRNSLQRIDGLISTPNWKVSPDGKYWAGLLSTVEPGEQPRDSLHLVAIDDGKERWRENFLHPVRSTVFSHDSKYIAVALMVDPARVLVFDCLTGKQLHDLSFTPLMGLAELGPEVTFSADGRQVLLRTIHGSDPDWQTTIRAWNVSDGELDWQRTLPGTCFLYSGPGWMYVIRATELKAHPSQDVQLSLIDLETGADTKALGKYPVSWPLTFSPDGNLFCVENQVCNLRIAQPWSMRLEGIGFSNDSLRMVAMQRRYPARDEYRPGEIPSRYTLPLVRHCWPTEREVRLVSLHSSGGGVAYESPWLPDFYAAQLVRDPRGTSAILEGPEHIFWRFLFPEGAP